MTETNEALRERVRKAIQGQKPKTVTVLSSLLAVHDALGYLPKEAIEEVAETTHSTVNDVWGVASFYPNFRFEPPPAHQLEVCWGTSCHVTGATRLYREALKELGLEHEGDSPDGHACLHLDTCMSVCSQGPVVKLDHVLRGHMTTEKLRELLRGLAPGPGRGLDGHGPSRNGHE